MPSVLPPSMKQWYGTVFDYKEEGSHASYSIERYHMTDLALRYVHGAISEEEFRDICRVLFHFISIRKIRQVTDSEYDFISGKSYRDCPYAILLKRPDADDGRGESVVLDVNFHNSINYRFT